MYPESDNYLTQISLKSQEKRLRHEEIDGDDDIFGFGETPLPKKLSSISSNVFKSDKIKDTEDDNILDFGDHPQKSHSLEKVSTVVNGEKSKVIRQDENENQTSYETSAFSSKLDITGFIGKGDISFKSEIKTELTDNTSRDMSELSSSLVKVTLLNLYRPDTSKPVYVAACNPELNNKPVANFKRFKKQTVTSRRCEISLKTYVPVDMNRTGIEEWFNQNKDFTQQENERDIIDKQSEDF